MDKKNVMYDRDIAVGDEILCGGRFARVVAIKHHVEGTHPDSPIRNSLAATEYVTSNGSRWIGWMI